jgi:hypothetical protein
VQEFPAFAANRPRKMQRVSFRFARTMAGTFPVQQMRLSNDKLSKNKRAEVSRIFLYNTKVVICPYEKIETGSFVHLRRQGDAFWMILNRFLAACSANASSTRG